MSILNLSSPTGEMKPGKTFLAEVPEAPMDFRQPEPRIVQVFLFSSQIWGLSNDGRLWLRLFESKAEGLVWVEQKTGFRL